MFREYLRLDRERGSSGISGPAVECWSESKRKLDVHLRLDRRKATTNLSRDGLFIRAGNPLPTRSKRDREIFVETGSEQHSFGVVGK